MSAFRNLPFYPWLLGVYPILYLYVENLGLVVDSEAIFSILLMLVGTTIVFLLLRIHFRNIQLAAFATALCSVAFSLSGHIYVLLFLPRSLGIWTMMVLLVLASLLFALRKIRSQAFFARSTAPFNLVALVLFAIQCFGLAVGLGKMSRYATLFAEISPDIATRQATPKALDSATKPDIYYIIPDGYPSDRWLESRMEYDNSAFSSALELRGFTVVEHAQSNYGITLLAMASVLNMQFYDSNPSPYGDLDYIRLEIANSRVARNLVEMGYSYVQLLSGFLIPSTMADINREFTPLGPIDIEVDIHALSGGIFDKSESRHLQSLSADHILRQSFFRLYVDTTLLRLARSQLDKILQRAMHAPYDSNAPERFLAATAEVEKIASMPEATFTIIHLLKPHNPVVFNERGDILHPRFKPTRDEFISEFGFTNSRFLQMIDSILAASENPPIIILQADHGSLLGQGNAADGRSTLFDIYAVYLIPPVYAIDFPSPFTTINVFPVILNGVFGTAYELEADKLFELTKKYEAPFAQVEVTRDFLNG